MRSASFWSLSARPIVSSLTISFTPSTFSTSAMRSCFAPALATGPVSVTAPSRTIDTLTPRARRSTRRCSTRVFSCGSAEADCAASTGSAKNSANTRMTSMSVRQRVKNHIDGDLVAFRRERGEELRVLGFALHRIADVAVVGHYHHQSSMTVGDAAEVYLGT